MKQTGILFITIVALLMGCEQEKQGFYKVENSFSTSEAQKVTVYYFNSSNTQIDSKNVGDLAPGEVTDKFEVNTEKVSQVKAEFITEGDITGDEIISETSFYPIGTGKTTTVILSPLN